MNIADRLHRHHLSRQTRIVMIYLVTGLMWVVLSDRVFASLSHNLPDFLTYQSLKGSSFVLITALLLHMVLRHDFRQIEDINQRLRRSYATTIKSWVRVMDARHQEPLYHTERVQRMTVAFARMVGFEGKQLDHIAWGSLLHDIGKMGLDDELLRKEGTYTEQERREMQKYPEIGKQFLGSIEFFDLSINIPWCQHENWDGSGYPRGIKGETIPLEARLFSIVNVWDALISERPYKDSWPRDKAMLYLREQAGSKFDPILVDVFLDNLDRIEQASKHKLD